MSLQYKVELAAAGMVNGDGTASLADRLARLRKYMLERGRMQMIHLRTLHSTSQYWNSNVFLNKDRRRINIFRLPSASQGIPERIWTVRENTIPFEIVTRCIVDFTQDLIVLLSAHDLGEYVHLNADMQK